MQTGFLSLLAAASFSSSIVLAQLTGDVGPLTTREEKNATKVCNVLDYGGEASKTADVGPAISSAFVSSLSRAFSRIECILTNTQDRPTARQVESVGYQDLAAQG